MLLYPWIRWRSIATICKQRDAPCVVAPPSPLSPVLDNSDAQTTNHPVAPQLNEISQRKKLLACGTWLQHFALLPSDSLQFFCPVGRPDSSLCSGSPSCCYASRTPQYNGLSGAYHSCLGLASLNSRRRLLDVPHERSKSALEHRGEWREAQLFHVCLFQSAVLA